MICLFRLVIYGRALLFMGIYTQYTLKKTIPVITFHRCSSCGRLNIKRQQLRITGSYNDKGTLTQRGVDKRERQAREKMDQDTEKLLAVAQDLSNLTKYAELHLNSVCSSCRHIEIWGDFHDSWMKSLMNFLSIVTFLVACVGLYGCLEGDEFPFKYLIPPLAPLLITGAVFLIRRAYRFKQLSKLDKRYLPRIACSPEAVDRFAHEFGADPNAIRLSVKGKIKM